ncbi:MAG TPA: hypothetical protein DCS93_12540 [Microscillaceae bacterium]|nr:hypothetical protein [Microscillaceae bacterium]
MILTIVIALACWIYAFYCLATQSKTANVIRGFGGFVLAVIIFYGLPVLNENHPELPYVQAYVITLIAGCILTIFFFFLDKSHPHITKRLLKVVQAIYRFLTKVEQVAGAILTYGLMVLIIAAIMLILYFFAPRNVLIIGGVLLGIVGIILGVRRYRQKRAIKSVQTRDDPLIEEEISE